MNPRIPKIKKQLSLFQAAVQNPIRCFKWIGIFPMTNLNSPRTQTMYRIFTSWVLVGQCIIGLSVTYWFFSRSPNFGTLPNIVFYVNGITTTILVLNFSYKWPDFIERARDIENYLMPDSSSLISTEISTKCRYLFMFFFFFGMTEHILCKSYLFHMVFICNDNWTTIQIIYQYEYVNLPFAKQLFPNRLPLFYLEITSFHSTVVWIIVDIFLMCISVYIAACFKKLNKLIDMTKLDPVAPWKEYREYHSMLISFINFTNQHMGPFLLISLSQNIFFICIQLFNTIDHGNPHRSFCDSDKILAAQHSLEHTLYYVYSTIFFITKTLTIVLLIGDISTVAREPIFTLCYVPDDLYGPEVQRFNRELRYTKCAFRGVFFDITKDKVVKVLGKVITYELMMLQLRIYLQVPTSKTHLKIKS